jgi:HD-GYP domain-containing protein (c-di-GMP phosphodiesterase class II)
MKALKQDLVERNLYAGLILLLILLAAIDSIAPSWVHVESLYILPVLLSLQSKRRDLAISVAGIGTYLIVWITLLSVDNVDSLSAAAGNRAVAVVIIWTVAIFCLLRERHFRRHFQAVFTETNRELVATRDIAVQTLAKVSDSHDLDTGRHIDRICAFSRILADELRKDPAFAPVIDEDFLTGLRHASLLHDIGKVAIRDFILQKPGRLTTEERAEMKQHTIIGTNILDEVINHHGEAAFLKMAAAIAHYHHERFDGKGYPAGLSGKAIPLAARIVALADVYDALTSERPYKNAYPPVMARKMIELESGTQFDPDVVDAFLRRFTDFVDVQLRYPSKHVHIFGLTESLVAEYCT